MSDFSKTPFSGPTQAERHKAGSAWVLRREGSGGAHLNASEIPPNLIDAFFEKLGRFIRQKEESEIGIDLLD